jgi:hypothetical protein
VQTKIIDLSALTRMQQPAPAEPTKPVVDLGRASIELQPVERRQVFVDGTPVGNAIE